MTHPERILHLRPAKIQVSVLQAQVFRSRDLIFDWKGRGFGLTESPQLAHDDFNLTGLEVGILEALAADANPSRDCDHEFRSQALGTAVQFRVNFGNGNDFSNAFPVAQIQENELAVITPTVNPTHQHNVFFLNGGSQIAACVSPFQLFHYNSSSLTIRCSFVD